MTRGEVLKIIKEAREQGKRPNLSGAALNNADLRDADLCDADLRDADLCDADLRDADLSYADLHNAKFSYADLHNAKFSYADLRGSNLDFSSGIPLRCTSFDFKADVRLMRQLAYHFCRIDCEDKEVKEIQKALYKFANKSHLVHEHLCDVLRDE